MSYQVSIEQFSELSTSEQEVFIHDQRANFLRINHKDRLLALECDNMESEDARFTRDLSWVAHALREAYNCGFADAALRANKLVADDIVSTKL